MNNIFRPNKQGLYEPSLEHDACGVGMVCNLKGKKSHEIVQNGLQILQNLTHRGAAASDGKTGDGAGILTQIPHDFFVDKAKENKIKLPPEKEYGSGLFFLPPEKTEQKKCMEITEQIIRQEGQVFLGWRDIPIQNDMIGEIARKSQPDIKQVFIGRGKGLNNEKDFERKLYIIRKVIEKNIKNSDLQQKHYFYIPSLSSQTIVYKGMFLAEQVSQFYTDLNNPLFKSGLAIVHQRYSTNTFPSWDLAQPFRFLSHNGEINTLRGNVNWMIARENILQSPIFGDDIKKILPIISPGASDSASLDNAVELLYHTGRSLPHAIMMLIPEAWQNHDTMKDEKKAFYEYHSHLMEPWDGPASIPFSDGKVIGAVLDRNGLRPSRYLVTTDDIVIMGSETGVLDVDPSKVKSKGRLQPGRMFLVDTEKGEIINDDTIKTEITQQKSYRLWLKKNQVRLHKLPKPQNYHKVPDKDLEITQRFFGYTLEDYKYILMPMASKGMEAVGSMGTDIPLAVFSKKPQLLYNYFKQLFAQVTNPPLDAIREKMVTSLITNAGPEKSLFEETPEHCQQIRLDQPILTNEELEKIREIQTGNLKAKTIYMHYKVQDGGKGLEKGLNTLFEQVEAAVNDGYSLIILSDRNMTKEFVAIPALLASAGVHHYLIRKGIRTKCALIIESGEPREVHHFAVLFGYGIAAVNPYLAFESIELMIHKHYLKDTTLETEIENYMRAVGQQHMIRKNFLKDINLETAIDNYIKAIGKGILKVMSKMGISTLHSYRGAQIFEAIGIDQNIIDKYFTWTVSRIEGIGLNDIAHEIAMRYNKAYGKARLGSIPSLDVGGIYQWRRKGEYHLFNPLTIAKLQQAARENDPEIYKEYAKLINDQEKFLVTLRGLMEFTNKKPIPIEEVEPIENIVKRFKTGAMSYGSLSQEAHETLAIAMNRMGAKSNSGEGGEDSERFIRMHNGDSRRSAIKQIASGRFGVTSNYLIHAEELQIKMAQGAKPGEGGQLPGEKVLPWIATTRHSTPYVSLISPPPHHDIYSIEDMAQLIHDLKNANPNARINVKLVSEAGVGTVAAGVAKGKADVILVSGWDGGTGASPQTSLKHAGLPWELGISETHQTLVKNNLRDRVVIEADGQMKTGRDVAIACLLGAEEFGFGTAPLVVSGCIMMRVCHLNTCPAGVATQDPALREKFTGKAEHIINFFHFVAQELRVIMAQLGFRTMNEMVGQVDKLKKRDNVASWKAKQVNLNQILLKAKVSEGYAAYNTKKQDHLLEKALDVDLINKCQKSLDEGKKITLKQKIRNINRTVGTMLSSEISKRYGDEGLPEDTITIQCSGSAGQSFGAFAAPGLTFYIEGDANDYLGKGLSGGKIIIYPPKESNFDSQENILIGNVALYGATSGELYVRGKAGERFCVRNSGAIAVVEGVGDHGCEYMTGGRAIILGPTGRNFAAGMSGGIAYVYDKDGEFTKHKCNKEMVELEGLVRPLEIAELHEIVLNHYKFTGSEIAKELIDEWNQKFHRFVKVMPIEYKKALERLANEKKEPMSVA